MTMVSCVILTLADLQGIEWIRTRYRMILDHQCLSQMVDHGKTMENLRLLPYNFEGEFKGESAVAVVSEIWALTQRYFLVCLDGNYEYDLGCIYCRTGALSFDGLDVY